MTLRDLRTTTFVSAISVMLWASTASAQETIKIGINQPLTGSVAASGITITEGAKLAIAQINAKGGILGKKLELVIEDNKSNPSEAVAAAEKLIVRDKVPVLMGAWSSTSTLAVMPKLMEYGVPMIVETSSSSKVTTAGNPWIFRIAPTSEMEAKAFSAQINKLGIKKADFLVVNNDWGRGAADDFGRLVKDHKGAIGTVEMMDASAKDMGAQLAKIKSSDADTLFVTTGVEQLTLVLKQARDLGLTRKIVTTGGSQLPDQLIAQSSGAADGTYHLLFFTPWFPEAASNPDVAVEYVKGWQQANGDPAGVSDAFRGYDSMLTIAAAIQKAGKAEPAAIRDALWQIDVKGVNGNIKFEKVGPAGKESGQSSPNVYLVQIKGGKVVRPFE